MHLDRFLFCGFQPGSCLSDAIPGVGNGVIILVALFWISCKYKYSIYSSARALALSFFPSESFCVNSQVSTEEAKLLYCFQLARLDLFLTLSEPLLFFLSRLKLVVDKGLVRILSEIDFIDQPCDSKKPKKEN